MQDILDKIKKFYEDKGKPFVDKIKEKVDLVSKENKRYLGVVGLFVIFIVVLVFFAGPEFNAERIAKENSREVSGEDYVPDAVFQIDVYPEVNELIMEYFDAYVAADFATLESIVTPLSEMEKSYITAMSPFYEEYQNIKCYTKHGLSKNSYIVSVCFDIKFKDQPVTAPSMLLFYVQTNEKGELYINNLYSDFNINYSELAINKNVYTALRKYMLQEDYLELYNQVEVAFVKLIKENNDLYQLIKRTIAGTRQVWEETVYYAERPEETSGTEGTEGTEETEIVAPDQESSEQPPQSEMTPEQPAEPVVQKVRVKTADSVRVRSGAGTDFTKLGDVYDGDIFVKLGEETSVDGSVWIKIQYNDSTAGYIYVDYVENVTE